MVHSWHLTVFVSGVRRLGWCPRNMAIQAVHHFDLLLFRYDTDHTRTVGCSPYFLDVRCPLGCSTDGRFMPPYKDYRLRVKLNIRLLRRFFQSTLEATTFLHERAGHSIFTIIFPHLVSKSETRVSWLAELLLIRAWIVVQWWRIYLEMLCIQWLFTGFVAGVGVNVTIHPRCVHVYASDFINEQDVPWTNSPRNTSGHDAVRP